MEKIAIVQLFNNPEREHERICEKLAFSGGKAGFDIMGIHKGNFKKNILKEAELLVITNMLDFYKSQQNDLNDILINKKKLFVRCVFDLSEIETNQINKYLYKLSKANYFCSPDIFKKYLDLEISGCLSFLAGKIDNSWEGLNLSSCQNENKAISNFWRDIDNILQKEKIADAESSL